MSRRSIHRSAGARTRLARLAVTASLLGTLAACTASSPHGPSDTSGSGSAVPTIAVPATGKDSISAARLLGSVGVNVHIGYNDTSYADVPQVLSLLRLLGVTHVRAALYPTQPDQVAKLIQLGRGGIRYDFIVGNISRGRNQQVSPALLNEARAVAPYTDALESPNEEDCARIPDWVSRLTSYADTLHNAIDSVEDLDNVRQLAPSFCHPGSIARFGDRQGVYNTANLHVYSNGLPPERKLESLAALSSRVQGKQLPLVITETGYHDAPDASTQGSATQQAIAAYTVRSILDAARIGVSRTYLYELLDEKSDPSFSDPEQHFGLASVDYQPKPAFLALRNLLADVRSHSTGSASSSAGDADADEPQISLGSPTARSLLIRDADGKGVTLALWSTSPFSVSGPPADQKVVVRFSDVHRATSQTPTDDNQVSNLAPSRTFTLHAGPVPVLTHFTQG